MTTFDKSQAYERTVRPLLEKLTDVCKRNAIPFFFTAAIENSAKSTVYINTSLMPLAAEVYLTDDRFEDYLKIDCGYVATLPEIVPEIEL